MILSYMPSSLLESISLSIHVLAVLSVHGLVCYARSVFVPQFRTKRLSAENGESPSVTATDMTTIDELKRAFELVEVSSPGISDQLLTRIYVHLQHRYVRTYRVTVEKFYTGKTSDSGTSKEHPYRSTVN